MVNARKIEIDKLYQKIDKLAKVGRDNYINYHILVDSLINSSQYSLWVETLEIKYDYIVTKDVSTEKKQSWNVILFNTKTVFQELQSVLYKEKSIYQVGPYYYKQLPRTRLTVIDTKGSGAELEPVIVDGHLQSVNIIKRGLNYSASASIAVTGGLITASVSPVVIAGKIYSVNIIGSGSSHNIDPKLGTIEEFEDYVDIFGEFNSRDLRLLLPDKRISVVATIYSGTQSPTQSATFSFWDTNKSFDKNLSNLYSVAFDYLLASV